MPLFVSSELAKRGLENLPILQLEALPKGWDWIQVPHWASHVVPRQFSGLLVPRYEGFNSYQNYPWWNAINYYIDLESEISHEASFGPIHSYSRKLRMGGLPFFDFAWVNRIAAFLKSWSSQMLKTPEYEIFGPLTSPKITLTHDVDALSITTKLRFKQVMHRLLELRLKEMYKLSFTRNSDDFLESLISIEETYGFKSTWFIYAKSESSSRPSQNFFDPEYTLADPRLRQLLQTLKDKGHRVGLHGSFSSWNNTERLAKERKLLSQMCGFEVFQIRQHWLKFCVTSTWKAQHAAGLNQDFTLGFNDRVGFRASTSLPIKANMRNQSAFSTIIMDSTLFSRRFKNFQSRQKEIDRLLDEIETFGGHVAINWHPHTLSNCYDWKDTYKYLLDSISKRKIVVEK